MKKVVSFSGGRTSARLTLLAVEEFGAENVAVVYMDTGAEHPLTYEFIRKLVEVFGVELVCLRGDFDQPLGKGVSYNIVPLSECKFDMKPFREMMKKYGTPYIGGMFCTDRMKLTPFNKYCKDRFDSHETWLGIRVDEPTRLRDKKGIRYLAEICDDEKQDIISWWSEQVFDLEIPEWLGNCVFCPKKSNLKLAAAQRDEPGLYSDWLDAMKDESVRFVDTRTTSLMKLKGVKPYYLLNTSKASSRLMAAANSYNESLFTNKNKKWNEYAKEASLAMHRGKRSLESLIATFDGSTGKEIKARIRGGKMIDTNSCSESCEVFQ